MNDVIELMEHLNYNEFGSVTQQIVWNEFSIGKVV